MHGPGEGDLGGEPTLITTVAQHLQNGLLSPLMEALLLAKPCAEHFISISLHFYKTLTSRASEHVFTEEAQRV